MRSVLMGVRSRVGKLDIWLADERWKAKWRRFNAMNVEKKSEFLRDLLPTIPDGHPAREAVEKLVARLASGQYVPPVRV